MITKEHIVTGLTMNTSTEVIKHLCSILVEHGAVDEYYADAVIAREKSYPTGLPTKTVPIAIPHADNTHVHCSAIAVAQLAAPIEFLSMEMTGERIAVAYVFLLAIADPKEQLEFLRRVMTIIQDDAVMEELANASNSDEVLQALRLLW